jgi:AraC-like DNA-binding protein
VRSAVNLAGGADFTITAVTCQDDHKDWSEAEDRDSYGVVLVRHGRFRRRAAGIAADVDPTLGYVSVPGREEHFAHPAGGDVCTSVSLSPRLWRQVGGNGSAPDSSTLFVDAELDLAHRRLLVAARGGDVEYALTEELLTLLVAACTQVIEGPSPARTSPAELDRVIVAAAREAILDGHPDSDGLLPLADLLGVSPYRLSRSFSRELGVSLTHYRNRVRVGRALDRLEAGAPSLACLAADLRFADQAHMCRTVRTHVGHTPAALRRMLASEPLPA